MYCKKCGAILSENDKFCASCGTGLASKFDEGNPRAIGGSIGFSSKINDPAFTKYINKSNRWAVVFSAILAVAAIIGFFIYGETSSEMENPQALFIGMGIGGMFVIIALFQVIARKRSRTWDGTVIDKTVKKKSRRQSSGSDTSDYYIQYFTEYSVIIRDKTGKKHRMVTEDDDTVYNYYKIGDWVRHHAGLNSYEKYDKSKDSIIFCNACATLCSINDDVCFRCNCPLLK